MNDDPRSPKQRAVDQLAELWQRSKKASLTNGALPQTTIGEISAWSHHVSMALKDRRFYSLADQLHFEHFGLVPNLADLPKRPEGRGDAP
jgi:hypothetical protein